MKRYSISIAYGRDRKTNKLRFQYYGRTDSVESAVEYGKERLERWIRHITDENYKYRHIEDDYIGTRITDSQTKNVVYEESHLAEEYGVARKIEWNGNTYKLGEWIKL